MTVRRADVYRLAFSVVCLLITLSIGVYIWVDRRTFLLSKGTAWLDSFTRFIFLLGIPLGDQWIKRRSGVLDKNEGQTKKRWVMWVGGLILFVGGFALIFMVNWPIENGLRLRPAVVAQNKLILANPAVSPDTFKDSFKSDNPRYVLARNGVEVEELTFDEFCLAHSNTNERADVLTNLILGSWLSIAYIVVGIWRLRRGSSDSTVAT